MVVQLRSGASELMVLDVVQRVGERLLWGLN